MGRLEHRHEHHHQQRHQHQHERHRHEHQHQHELLLKLHVQQPKLDQHVLELRVLLLGEMVRKQLVSLMVLVGSV